jgi:hypothetical protein
MKRLYTALLLLAMTLPAALAAGSGDSLSSLTREEQQLSRSIRKAYSRGKVPADLYNRLIRVHQKIRRASSVDPEIKNMATFLTFCLQDLRGAITAPHSRANVEIVSDLDSAIQEGAGYIRTMSRHKALASR